MPRLILIETNQIKSNQIKSNQIKSSQIKSNQRSKGSKIRKEKKRKEKKRKLEGEVGRGKNFFVLHMTFGFFGLKEKKRSHVIVWPSGQGLGST
jgi:hypothetical protein